MSLKSVLEISKIIGDVFQKTMRAEKLLHVSMSPVSSVKLAPLHYRSMTVKEHRRRRLLSSPSPTLTKSAWSNLLDPLEQATTFNKVLLNMCNLPAGPVPHVFVHVESPGPRCRIAAKTPDVKKEKAENHKWYIHGCHFEMNCFCRKQRISKC